MGLQANVCRLKRRLLQLGTWPCWPLHHTAFPASKSSQALKRMFGCFRFNVGLGNGELDTLILTNGPSKNHTLIGITTGLINAPVGIANALGSN